MCFPPVRERDRHIFSTSKTTTDSWKSVRRCSLRGLTLWCRWFFFSWFKVTSSLWLFFPPTSLCSPPSVSSSSSLKLNRTMGMITEEQSPTFLLLLLVLCSFPPSLCGLCIRLKTDKFSDSLKASIFLGMDNYSWPRCLTSTPCSSGVISRFHPLL